MLYQESSLKLDFICNQLRWFKLRVLTLAASLSLRHKRLSSKKVQPSLVATFDFYEILYGSNGLLSCNISQASLFFTWI